MLTGRWEFGKSFSSARAWRAVMFGEKSRKCTWLLFMLGTCHATNHILSTRPYSFIFTLSVLFRSVFLHFLLIVD